MAILIKLSTEEDNLLKPIREFAKSRKAKLYLVGGFLRDKILGRKKEGLDFDFAVKRGAIRFGKALAKELRCGFVVLDKEHGSCRVVKKLDGKIHTFDFTDFRGKTLEEDILHRDFTINTLYMGLDKGEVIDLYGAREDLKRKIIRQPHKNSFHEDPLRVLRAFSFSGMLGFSIDKDTLKNAKQEKLGLAKVSFERIRDELFKVFSSDKSYECLAHLDELEILKIIFPEFKKMSGIGQGPYHHLDVWQHTLETVRQLEGVYAEVKKNSDVQDFLNEVIAADRTRRQLLKLGALLHDVGKPKALRHKEGKLIFHGHERVGLDIMYDIARRLKLSNDEIRSLHKIVLWHLRPGYMADNHELSARAKFRYFRDAASEAASILLLSVADQRATKGPLTTRSSRLNHEKVCFSLIRGHFRKSKEKKPVRLINGDDLIKEFRLSPSPLIGKILSELEEAQAIGKIKTKQEALRFAQRLIK